MYWPVGRVRRMANCFEKDFDFWIDGYPRSASNFCVQAFQLANPAVRIRNSRHLPPLIIQALTFKKPGIFLLRKPVDAACSWAIYWQSPVGPCLDYYIDFHWALRRHVSGLFIASFELVTGRFPSVIEECNRRFGTDYAWRGHDAAFIQQCFALINGPESSVDERRVCRPSPVRQALKAELLEEIQTRPALKRKLDRANELYLEFKSAGRRRHSTLFNSSTAQVPTLT